MTMLLFALLLQGAFATEREGFEAAEALYQEQRFVEAIEIYETLRAQGIEDGVLYYNLGNAYFKAGRLGRAILSYERALELMPGDEDTRANLAYARELVAEPVETPPLPFAIAWAVELYRLLSPGLLARVLSLSFLLGGGVLTLLLTDRWPRWRTGALATFIGFGVLAMGSGAGLAFKLYAEAHTEEAVVLSDNAYVRSGPGASSPRLAEIYEGHKVRILAEREGWYQVELANGLTGWIPRDDVEPI